MTYTIDHTKGQRIGTVSQQWASRPDDQKFLSLEDMRAQVAQWAAESSAVEIVPADIEATYDERDPHSLSLRVAGAEIDATHYGFDQITRLAGVPSPYVRSLPAPLAALNLNYGLQSAEQKAVAAYLRSASKTTIRAITSTSYGRIYDRDVVDAVIRVQQAGDWKVPGTIDWQGKTGVAYNPNVDVTKETTTLYASDRDCFLFLVDDHNPIEVGTLPNGDPDLMFRGFYVWNSEVGGRSFGISTMYLRGVCQNRNLWGVERFHELSFAHRQGAPDRFMLEARPALDAFASASPSRLISGVQAAKGRIVARTDEDRLEFLNRYGFGPKVSRRLIALGELEEGRAPESVWDFAQAITASARSEQYQEQRLRLEGIAGRLLDKVIA